MEVTRKQTAQKIIEYLHHRITLSELVDWAELAMMDAEFENRHFEILRQIISHIGLGDVKAFGLSWEDCENFLMKLGYRINLTVTELKAA